MTGMQEKKLVDTSDLIKNPIGKSIFKWIQPTLEWALGIKKLNQVYQKVHGEMPAEEFAKKVLEAFGVSYIIPEKDLQKIKSIEGPLVVVCNHPFGGIEALFLLIFLSEIRKDYKILANFLLKDIPEVKENLIFVDPFDRTDSQQFNIKPLKETIQYLKDGGLLGVFPSGEVASLKLSTGKISEPAWNPNIAKIIQKTKATVIPLYFHGRNSNLFQLASMVNPMLRTSLLVKSLVNPNVKKLHYQIGQPISAEKISEITDPESLSEYLYAKTHLLGTRYDSASHFNLHLVPSLQTVEKEEEAIMAEIQPEVIKKEIESLPANQFLCKINDLEVIWFEAQQCPETLLEIGRLREITFRAVGEGSGKSCDLDKYDQYYLHLVIYDRSKNTIAGAYRMGKTDEILKKYGKKGLYTYSLFRIHNVVFEQINPALEMGRSFIRAEYQKNFASLMLLWMGIGHYVAQNPQYNHLFGPVSISGEFHQVAKDLMVHYLREFQSHKELEEFVKPRKKFKPKKSKRYYNSLSIKDLKDVQELVSEVELSGFNVPVLIKQYLKLGGKILAFNIDPDFKYVVDGLILVDLRQTEAHSLQKYMGKEGYASFMKYHETKQS